MQKIAIFGFTVHFNDFMHVREYVDPCLNCFGDFDVTLFAVRKYNLSLLGRLHDGLEVVPGIGGAQDWCNMYDERGLEALEIADLHWC